jgi:nucleoside phosphorylase
LVGARHALTTAAVAKAAGEGAIAIELPAGRFAAKLEAIDPNSGGAVLTLDRGVEDVIPLPLGVDVQPGDAGQFYGFAASLGGAGVLIDGRVQDTVHITQVGQKPWLLVFPSHAVNESFFRGFTGAPLVVRCVVVGVLVERSIDSDFLLFLRIQDFLDLLPKEVATRVRPTPRTERAGPVKSKNTVTVFTALDEELDYLYEEEELDWSDLKVSQDGLSYRRGRLGDDTDVIAASARSMGLIASAILATKAFKEWRPTVAVMIGICAGRKDKGVNIGDVIVASQCFHYQFGAYEDGNIRRELRVENTETQVIDVVEHLSRRTRSLTEIQESLPRGFKKPKTVLQCHVGPMASADLVVKDVNKFGEAIEADRKTIAVDMESYAFMRAARLANLRWSFVIKSVSDFADAEKGDEFREYAKLTAAKFTLQVVRSMVSGWT